MASSTEKLVRIKKRPEYLAVSATRRRWVTPSFILQAKPSNDTEALPRAGFTASRKVGNAVKRSKAKRRIREAARFVVPEHGLNGWDYVFVCRECMTDYPFEKLCSDIKWALAKLASGADLKTKPKKQKHG